jgi:hypothetical protein
MAIGCPARPPTRLSHWMIRSHASPWTLDPP